MTWEGGVCAASMEMGVEVEVVVLVLVAGRAVHGLMPMRMPMPNIQHARQKPRNASIAAAAPSAQVKDRPTMR